MSATLITRADDFGSSHSANLAILTAIREDDYIKNISIMAPGPLMKAGAEALRDQSQVCLGMHLTLNAEWALIKWPPISPGHQVQSLVNPLGVFFDDPAVFASNPPRMEEILLELNAQLDYLTRLGLSISYVDSHMLPEKYIPGLSVVLGEWAMQKGLLNHLQYYRFPGDKLPTLRHTREHALADYQHFFSQMKDGQYFVVHHPAQGFRDMLLCTNDRHPMGLVLSQRAIEYQLIVEGTLGKICREQGITCLRYDQATPQKEPYRW